MAEVPVQTCWSCRWFRVDYDGPYSEVTPGVGFSMKCEKGVYYLSDSMDEQEFGEAMEKGFTCPLFERRKPKGER